MELPGIPSALDLTKPPEGSAQEHPDLTTLTFPQLETERQRLVKLMQDAKGPLPMTTVRRLVECTALCRQSVATSKPPKAKRSSKPTLESL